MGSSGLARRERRGVACARRARLLAIALLAFGLFVTPAAAQTGNQTGNSSRDQRREAIEAIPIGQLAPDAQQKISAVLERVALYRRLPATKIETDPDLFVLLARYPEIVVEIWKLMGVSQMECQRTGPYTLRSDDGSGTASEIELVYGTSNLHLFYGTGTYTGNLMRKPVDAECVLLLRTSYGQTADGRPTSGSTLDVFIKIDNALVGAAARTLLPLVGRTADHNFVETLRFVQRLNETTEKNGPGVQGMAWRLEGLQPDVRDQYITTSGIVHERALQRAATAATAPISPPAEPPSLPPQYMGAATTPLGTARR
jgi:hypothetical protein